jgi:hypothetical protein
LLTLCFASAATPGANAGGSDDVPWQEIAALATNFVTQESASRGTRRSGGSGISRSTFSVRSASERTASC